MEQFRAVNLSDYPIRREQTSTLAAYPTSSGEALEASVAEVSGDLADHIAAADPHPVYLTQAEGDARYALTGGGGVWGGITGTLADQTDLATELSGKQPLAAVLTGTTASFTTAKDTKLSGIATGATANSSDATLLARANHTGTQTAATISDFNAAADARVTAGLTGYLTSAAAAAAYQPLDADLTTIAGLTATTDNFIVSVASAWASRTPAQVRTTLGLTALATTTPGTGVATALGINIGSAGAPVLFNGALGTPSSGTLTNCTFPTLNQSTTGSAATLTTSRNFSISGGGITAAAQGFNGSAAVVLNASVDAGHITLARMANLAANSLIGNNTGSAATPLALSASDVRTLINVANGATANSSDATLLARANHTGTQAVSTILAAATSRLFGRITASGGAGEELTGTQATTLLDTFTSALKGLAPASGGGTSNFLRADGSWSVPPGSGGLASDAWNSAGGSERLYFQTAASTYYKADTTHIFRVGADVLVATLSNAGIDLPTGFEYRINGANIFASPALTGSPTAPTQTAGDNSTKLATTAYARAAAPNAMYRSLLDCSGSHIAARVAGTYGFSQAQPLAISGTGTLYPLNSIYIDSADFPTVDGLSPKLRVRVGLYVNDVAPTGNFTFGLHPITRPATSGGAGLVIYTIGAAVSGSTVAINTPAADSSNNAVGSDFALPANGHYVLGVVTTATVATSSHLHMSALLQIRNA